MASEQREYQRRWRRKNKARVAEYNRRRRELRRDYKRRYSKAHPDANKLALQRWFATHPGKRNEYRAAYNARKKNLSVFLTLGEKLQLSALYKKAHLLTKRTGVRHHVDHIRPLSKGGLHHPNNLQILTAVENMRKSAR